MYSVHVYNIHLYVYTMYDLYTAVSPNSNHPNKIYNILESNIQFQERRERERWVATKLSLLVYSWSWRGQL